jgi:Succinylglutamate desuccinylase / Aspartoacylase family
MSLNATDTSSASGPRGWLPRILADVRGEGPGPSVVVVAGLRGDEYAGIRACERLLPALEPLAVKLRGRVTLLSGNRQALSARQPFIRRDLRQGWTQANLSRLRTLSPRELGDDDQEQRELAERLSFLERARRGRLILVELQSTSAPSGPCVVFADTLVNRRLARSLPVTAVLGLEEVLEGTVAHHFTELGHMGLTCIGGQEQGGLAVERLLSALWLLLVRAGSLTAQDVPDLAAHHARLAEAATGQPAVVEVRHRHNVAPGSGFQMSPGWVNFAPVARGAEIARDASGALLAPQSGLIWLPCYGGSCEGYCIVREVRPAWLKVSEWLRRWGGQRLLRQLPGIHSDRRHPDVLVVDPRVARSHVAEVMHLFGYRRRKSTGQRPVFSPQGKERR